MLEPSMDTVTCAVAVHPPCGLVTVTVKVVVWVRATVEVLCELGEVTMLAGSQWKLNEPLAPACALSCDVPPYITVLGNALAVGAGAA